MITGLMLIILGGLFCWGIYTIIRDRQEIRREREELARNERRQALQRELSAAHDAARIQGYWRERGEVIRPLAMRHCSEVDETV